MSKVIVRAFEMADWEGIAELRLLPNCRWGTLQMPYQSRDEVRRKLENLAPGFYSLVAVLQDTQKVIGKS